MLKKLKLLIAIAFSLLYIQPLSTLAATSTNCDNPATTTAAIQCGAGSAAGVPDSTNAETKVNSTVQNLINLLSVAVGILAVIMLIVGGFRYITSAGNPEATKGAKNTILYALIGLIIVALAQVIVNFVLNKTTQQAKKSASLIMLKES